MGSNQSANRLAINSMSKVVHFSRDELMALQKQFGKLAHGSENAHTVNRAQFHEALEIVGLHEKDKEILDRLFTLFDESGDGQVNFKEFVVGVSTVLRGTIEEKLTFSFHLFDTDSSGKVSPAEMENVLKSMNNTISYFGDEKAPDGDVESLVKEIFEKFDTNKDGELSFAEYMHAVAEHPTLVGFIVRPEAGETAAGAGAGAAS